MQVHTLNNNKISDVKCNELSSTLNHTKLFVCVKPPLNLKK